MKPGAKAGPPCLNRQFAVFLGAGLAVVGLLLAGVLYWTRGAHVELKGSVAKVRVQAMDERSAVAIADFRFVNPSNHPFIVRAVEVMLIDEDGKPHAGMVVAETDARRLFEYFPLLGQKFNETLTLRQTVAPRQGMDRMVAARFELPEARVQARRNLRIRVEDVDGAVSLIEERPDR